MVRGRHVGAVLERPLAHGDPLGPITAVARRGRVLALPRDLVPLALAALELLERADACTLRGAEARVAVVLDGAGFGYVYLYSMVHGFSRLAYTEPVADERGKTAAAFLARAKVWLAAHGITHHHRVITDNGFCYRSADFARIVGTQTHHQGTRPYTPRHNGKAERYQPILAEEVLHARAYTCEDERSAALRARNIHNNHHRPHNAAGDQPSGTRLKTAVTNLQPSYT